MSFLRGSKDLTAANTNTNTNDARTIPYFMNEKVALEGHPGHLSPQQQAALEAFRRRLIEAQLFTGGDNSNSDVDSETDGQLASHSEATLLRFLRARKFNVDGAFKQFSENEDYRKKRNIDELYRTFPSAELEAWDKAFPYWCGRRDKRGLPIEVYRIANVDSKTWKEIGRLPPERKLQTMIASFEFLTQGIIPLCAALSAEAHEVDPEGSSSLRTKDQICSTTSIVDLSGTSLRMILSMREHIQPAAAHGAAHYPEVNDVTLIINTPTVLSTVWSWIQGWFDPGVIAKFRILGNPTKDPKTLAILTSFIDRKDLPKAYGGELEWTVGEPPLLDEPAKRWLKEVMGVDEFKGPIVVDANVRRPAT